MKQLKAILISVILLMGYNGSGQDPHVESGLKKVVVQEVIQVSSYTYLHVLEEGISKWIAVPTIEAKVGEIYFYKGGMGMPNFESKELDRTFDTVLFLGYITNAESIDPEKGMVDPNTVDESAKPIKKSTLDRLELNIEEVKDGTRIGELFENKQQFNGIKIKVRGEVTKFNRAIMNRNWVHIQDGTAFEGAYDLMVTCQDDLAVGDVVVFEGVIALDKNFGAGYFYRIILEDAVIVR